MSPRNKGNRSARDRPNSRSNASVGSRAVWRWAAGASVLVVLVVSVVKWWPTPKPTLPLIDLRAVDPKVAGALTQRSDEILRHPRSPAAWGWFGALLWAYDFRAAAGSCLARAELLEPGNPRWPYYHALALLIATPNQAIPLLARTVSLCGNSPAAPRYRLAYLLAEQGRWDEARREWESLLGAYPEFAPARLLAARDAQRRGELDKALEYARGCVDDPRTARSALILESALYRQKGDLAAADQALRRSASVSPDQGYEDPFQAEVMLLRGDPRLLSEQAHPLLAAGQLKEAAALIDRLQREHSDDPETWLLAGRLHLLRKDLPLAERGLERHLQMSPRSVQGLFQLGLVLLAQERWTNAAARFEQATQIKPDFGPGYYNRGVALARAGQFRDAISAFRESLRHNPERLETYLFLADLLLRANERDSAMRLLDEAAFLHPNDPRLKSMRERTLR